MHHKLISNSLKKYRRVRGLKQKDVAKILGVKSISMISRWEKGVCLPRPLTMFKLAILYRTMTDAQYYDLGRTVINGLRKREEKALGNRTKDNEDR